MAASCPVNNWIYIMEYVKPKKKKNTGKFRDAEMRMF
jgi:hypothetical protein